MADGGYFDNYGIATIVELIFAAAPILKAKEISTIYLFDISPWSRGTAKQVAGRDDSFERISIQAVGPLSALFGPQH